MSSDRKAIRFISQDKEQKTFFTTLTRRVNAHFKENNISKKANTEMRLKTILLLLLYISPFVAILLLQPGFWISMALWAIMGLGLAGVGMNIMHDANHGAYSNSSTVNTILGTTLNLLGAASYNWKMQHNVLHHTYTNITGWDEDINGKGTLRLSPHVQSRSVYRLQWLYALLLYGIATLYWVVLKDFVQFIKYTINGVNKKPMSENIRIFLGIIVLKALYFGVIIGLPIWVFNIPVVYVLSGFILMHFVGGIVLTVVFQLAHTVEDTDHPLPNKEGNIENTWAIHQMYTTANFARQNRFINWCVGGLNFQVEHHLFPQICHVHYPKIAPIVKETAEEFGVPYYENETFRKAVRSHFRLLRKYGRLPDLNEAIG